MKNDNAFDSFRVMLLALGHFTVDVYANLLPPLLPVFYIMYSLNDTAISLLTAVFSVTSTLIQPVFGYIADKYGKKWIAALGVAWVSVGMCLLGEAPGYMALVIMVGLAGIGSSMYHPQASAMVPKVSGNRKGLGMSLFMAGGNIGYSLMPLIAVIIVAVFGVHSLIWLIPPGVIVGLLIYLYAPRMDVDRQSTLDLRTLFGSFREVKGPLTTLLTVVSLRAWVCMGMITFIPIYFMHSHFEGWALFGHDIAGIGYAITLFLFILADAVGGIIGGWAADRWGNKKVTVPTLLAAAPVLFLAFVVPDILVWPLIVLAGGLVYASISPTTLLAQEMLPRSQGMAGGLTLGFANGIGGLLVLVTGVISDYLGRFDAILSLILILVIAGLIAAMLPGDKLKVEAPAPMIKQ
ncbi:MFS transporter [Methanocella arvoryzae]|uniref:Permease (Major facilitator superfamily) n=1 Tax=Methanocella arvoryzae (strain DSM 22066 / NBRC 105507 / MRE50) TaxID=351160 RepID=Q0W691_METAR|nr:MFS transporter [Methanocella arvoryzae]CAH04842.1 predicted fosmidomycin resistance protein [uncultured archaeon]CAJ36102.1 putative permease (major facilitator superfamily) [Methanocella arvoryzae MRE50]